MNYAPFSQVVGTGKVLIEFYRSGCPSCRLMAPAVKDAADRLGVKLLIADAAANQAVGEQLQIDAVPTVIMFTDGEERGRLVGRQPATVIEDFIKRGVA